VEVGYRRNVLRNAPIYLPHNRFTSGTRILARLAAVYYTRKGVRAEVRVRLLRNNSTDSHCDLCLFWLRLFADLFDSVAPAIVRAACTALEQPGSVGAGLTYTLLPLAANAVANSSPAHRRDSWRVARDQRGGLRDCQ
jgi:hypothetical protein